MKMDRMGMCRPRGGMHRGSRRVHGARELSDVQLTQLLRAERASATDPRAPLDAAAVDCLRAWSGDVELCDDVAAGGERRCGQEQPASSESTAGSRMRRAIRTRSASRTSSAPPSVRRAVALLIEHRIRRAAAAVAPTDTAAGRADASATRRRLRVHVGPGRSQRGHRRRERARRSVPEGQAGRGIRRHDAAARALRELLREAHRADAHAHLDACRSSGDARQAQMVTENAQRDARRSAARSRRRQSPRADSPEQHNSPDPIRRAVRPDRRLRLPSHVVRRCSGASAARMAAC